MPHVPTPTHAAQLCLVLRLLLFYACSSALEREAVELSKCNAAFVVVSLRNAPVLAACHSLSSPKQPCTFYLPPRRCACPLDACCVLALLFKRKALQLFFLSVAVTINDSLDFSCAGCTCTSTPVPPLFLFFGAHLLQKTHRPPWDNSHTRTAVRTRPLVLTRRAIWWLACPAIA